MSDVHPYVVTLSPGDVLFVPPYWWHFVQCIDFSISVNTWPPLSAHIDRRQHRREACVRTLIALIAKSGLIPDDRLLCPSEIAHGGCSWQDSIETLAAADVNNDDEVDDDDDEPKDKRRRSNDDDDVLERFVRKYAPIATPVNEMRIDELRLMLRNEGPIRLIDDERVDTDRIATAMTSTSSVSSTIDERRFIDCLLHRDVIAVLSDAIFRK